MRLLGKALTFDDVLLVPAYSQVLPRDTDLSTRLSRNIRLNLPLVSAAMDTVTEARLAIAIAQEGGVGIVHKNLSPRQQAAEVARVKRYESGVLRDPITITPDVTVRQVIALSRQHGFSGFPVLEGKTVVGIVTNRDLRFETRLDVPVREVMTPRERLVWVKEGATLEEGKALVIDQVRELGDYFALRPHYGTAKVAILEAADSMNRPAANALLKLLEEPPLGALIMLVADRPSQLLPTIRSRCQQFALDQGDPASILEWLCAQDGAGDARREVENLARAAGSPLAARALAEQGLATAIDGLVAGMGNIAIGKLQPLAAAAQFAPLPLTLLVDQMLRVCHELLLLKCGAALPLASLGREPEAGLLRLADALHSHGVGAFMQKALEVKRLKLGPVTLRELDLAESLWFDWQSLCTVDKRRAAAR